MATALREGIRTVILPSETVSFFEQLREAYTSQYSPSGSEVLNVAVISDSWLLMAMNPLLPRSKAITFEPLLCQLVTFCPAVALWKRTIPRVEVQRGWQIQSPHSHFDAFLDAEHALSISVSGVRVAVVPFGASSVVESSK